MYLGVLQAGQQALATMFANGYVGTSEDAQRLRKLDKQREQQRKKYEELQQKKKNEAAGLRQFGSSKAEAYEAAFKTETVGLVTRKEFIEKRATIQERLEEDELRERLEAEAAAAAEKERRRKEKEKRRAKAKLSFAADVSNHVAPACMRVVSSCMLVCDVFHAAAPAIMASLLSNSMDVLCCLQKQGGPVVTATKLSGRPSAEHVASGLPCCPCAG